MSVGHTSARPALDIDKLIPGWLVDGMKMNRWILVLSLFSACVRAGVPIPNDLADGEVASADEVMQNFEALKAGIDANASAIDSLPLPPSNCSVSQIIKWNGSGWVCTDDALSTQCLQGDGLVYSERLGWQCSSANQAFAQTDSWPGGQARVAELFENSLRITTNSYCYAGDVDACYLTVVNVEGDIVEDHRECTVSLDTGTSPEPNVSLYIGWVYLHNMSSLEVGQKLYVDISCPLP